MYELRRSRTNCDYSPKGWKWASGVDDSIEYSEKAGFYMSYCIQC